MGDVVSGDARESRLRLWQTGLPYRHRAPHCAQGGLDTTGQFEIPLFACTLQKICTGNDIGDVTLVVSSGAVHGKRGVLRIQR